MKNLYRNIINFDLKAVLSRWFAHLNRPFITAFITAFIALNLIFLYHGAHFLFGDHDWKYLKNGINLSDGLFEGRFSQFILINLLTSGDILPLINNLIGFLGYSLGIALLARYWQLPNTKKAYILFALFTAITPYILSFMYFAFLIPAVLSWNAVVITALIISEKETRFSLSKTFLATLLLTLALGGYPPIINLIGTAFAARLLFASLSPTSSQENKEYECYASPLLHAYRYTFLNIILALMTYKLILIYFTHTGAINSNYYNLQTITLAEIPQKALLTLQNLIKQFTITLPFINLKYKIITAALTLLALTTLISSLKRKADNTPSSVNPTTPASHCEIHSVSHTQPKQTSLSVARAEQPTQHLVVRTSRKASAFRSGTIHNSCEAHNSSPSVNPTTPAPIAGEEYCERTTDVLQGRGAYLSVRDPTADRLPSVSYITPSPIAGEEYCERTTDVLQGRGAYIEVRDPTADRLPSVSYITIFFPATLLAPFATFFISPSLAETEFSPRIDFFGFAYAIAAMLALCLKSPKIWIKNLALLLALSSIFISAKSLLAAQKTWHLGFTAEMAYYRRILKRYEQNDLFNPQNRYIIVQAGSPSFRHKYEHTPYNRSSDDLLDISYTPGLNSGVMWNYYSPAPYADETSYVYTFRPTPEFKRQLADTAPYPKENSVAVGPYWILLTLTPQSLQNLRTRYQ